MIDEERFAMPTPFPGMDPFIEQPAFWPDFHVEFLVNLRAQLNERLPFPYNAMIEETVRLVEPDPTSSRAVIPDVAVDRGLGRTQARSGPHAGATLEPVTLTNYEVEEVHDHWVEIRHRHGQDLITVIELLSPTNEGDEWEVYRAKRRSLLRQAVHLVELDLLIGGKRIALPKPPPPANYYAYVSRTEERPHCDVYRWSVRDPLPTVPIPLLKEDGDVPADLTLVFEQTYRRAAYDRLINYGKPPRLPLDAETMTWVAQTASAANA
jgi:hypothetical protein